MKIKTNKQPQGSILLVTMLTAFIVGMALASYLTLVSVQNQSTLRSQSWNSAVPVMEAGVEEALTALQYYGTTNLASGGWTLNSYDGFYHTTSTLRNGNSQNGYSYDVGIKRPALGQPDQPIIESLGYSPAPLNLATSYKGDLWNYQRPYGMILGGMIPLYTPDIPTTKRKVRVVTKNDPIFNRAMAAQGVINLNGRFVLTDSFDSSDPAASTLGKYDSTKNKANGDVATNGQLINVNNAGIMGHASTGPGGTISLGTWASVGDKAWVSASTIGIQPGHVTDDMNVDFPPVIVPAAAIAGSTSYSGSQGGAKLLTGSLLGSPTYFNLRSLTGKINVTGNVVVYVPAGGTVSFTGNDGITLANGATFTLYVGATTATIGGNGVINPGSALNFQYYGLPTNTSINFNGNASYTGSIYAPSADFTLGGGGSSMYDFVGSSITASVTMNGHYHFHYDEALAKTGPTRGYVVSSWNEVGMN